MPAAPAIAPSIPSGTRLLARLGRHGWLLIVGLLAAETQREIWMDWRATTAEHLHVTLVALVSLAALLAARRAPIPAALTGYALVFAMQLVSSPWEAAPTIAFANGFLAYQLGRREQGPRLRAAAGAVGVLGVLSAVLFILGPSEDSSIGGAITQAIFAVAPIFLGATLRDRATLHAALRARAAELEDDRETARARTVLEERARIAGELHDLIAHALSAVIVQASAARVKALHEPDRAEAAFAAVELTGRDALTEIRSMLGVLRAPGDDAGADLAPQPRVEHLPGLVARAALPTELQVDGEPRHLPPSVDLTAYRVVQECLALADRPGGATGAEVTITYEPAALSILVIDDGGVRPPLSTRERVRLYGGDLAAEPLRGAATGFRVHARLPIPEASA